ncbi:DUF3182 family protein [Stutzerimonas azotifigens]|uniref:DUF3182 family protein n=1 Tax=Stutzerimonas azotifigens TaxID=291995 RepID=UPI00040BF0FB|nr:DUF3182 family protein [Stutzerimonas azotifigens]
MPKPDHAPAGGRVVVTFPNRPREPEHEKAVHRALAERLARLLGVRFDGEYDPHRHRGLPLYLVPSGTLIGEHPDGLTLADEADLFGGRVPQAFIETKAISHPLVSTDAKAPQGWSTAFGERVADSVLPGFTAFCLEDAREAGRRLLALGPARIKPVHATGGRGQETFHDEQTLEQALATLDVGDVESCGLVVEAHLEHVTTFSVGQVRVGGQVVTYYGTQRLTPDNAGQEVYGGSDLTVVEGGFEALLALDLPERTRLAVSQAQVYDEAASACYPGLLASRRNYDIAQGIDGRGEPRSGVLEQSWRIGGASSAEIAALEVFAGGGHGRALKASSVEVYGPSPQLPGGATVLFQGEDAEVGYITKYVVIEDYGNP